MSVDLLLFLTLFLLTTLGICEGSSAIGAPKLLDICSLPLSHQSSGWDLTFIQYYQTIAEPVLNATIEELLKHPEYRFNWGYTSFLELFYSTGDQSRKDKLQKVLATKQLEICQGGWIMSDEACPSFEARVNQMTLGHEFLETLGVIPTHGWQLDPFGGSSLTPTEYKLLGFQAHLSDRIPLYLQNSMQMHSGMEFLWQASPSFGEETKIFTHNLDNSYCSASQFYFEDSDPVNSNNVAQYARAFVEMARIRSNFFKNKPNRVLIPVGCDFTFNGKNARNQYGAMDKIHAYINSHSSEFNAKIRYCTLSEYFDGIYNDPPADLPTYKHDFFPYNDDPYSYWTGFYTSRPALKSLVRELEALLRATEQAYVLSTLTKTLNGEYNLAGPSYVDLVLARNLSALSADHDFMAGTSREATILDMFDKMYTSRKHASLVLSSSIHNLLGIASKERKAKVLSGARIHSDDPSVTIGNYLAIHNSLAWTRNTIVKVLSNNSNIAVIDIDNNRACVQSQLVPSWVPQEFHKKREAPATYEFYFYAQLPPLGVKVYQIVASSPSCFANSSSIQPLTGNYAATIENDHVSFSVNFDSANANTTLTINNKKENSKYSILQQFLRYITCNGTKGGPADLCSGAYLFRPDRPAVPLTFNKTLVPHGRVVKGPFVNLIQQAHNLNPAITAEWKLDAAQTDPHIGLSLYVPHPEGNNDVILRLGMQDLTPLLPGMFCASYRISSDFSVHGEQHPDCYIFTDNGLEMRARTFDAQNFVEPFAGNYYPIIHEAHVMSVEDNKRMTLLANAPRGAATFGRGEMEVMLHRFELQDDGRGMSEPMNDTVPVSPSFVLLAANPSNSDQLRHRLSLELDNPPHIVVLQGTPKVGSFKPLNKELPTTVDLMTLQARNSACSKVGFRVRHLHEVTEQNVHDEAVSLDTLFAPPLKLSSFQERTLSFNQPVTNPSNSTVILKPLHVKSFLLQF